MRTDREMPRTARDPHHNGACEWGWDGQKLWHRQRGERWWVMVKRTHPTPRRMAVLAELMRPLPVAVDFADLLEDLGPERDPLV